MSGGTSATRVTAAAGTASFRVQRDSGGYYGYFTGTPKPHGTNARALAESDDGVHWRGLRRLPRRYPARSADAQGLVTATT